MREDGDDFSYLVSMLAKFGLSLSGKTTDVWVGRGEGIQSYLAEHPEIDEYVILDDNTFDFANYPKLWERLLLTNGIENVEYASKTPAIEAMLFWRLSLSFFPLSFCDLYVIQAYWEMYGFVELVYLLEFIHFPIIVSLVSATATAIE